MMTKLAVITVVCGLVSVASANDASREIMIESLSTIVELRTKQSELTIESGAILDRLHAQVRLSQAKVELEKARGNKPAVRLELNKIVTAYKEISGLDGEKSEEIRLQHRIDYELAKIALEKYRIENPPQDVIIGTGVSISVDF